MCVLCSMRGYSNGQFSGHVESALAFNSGTFTSSASYVNTLLEGVSWTGNTGTAANVGYSFGLSREGGALFNATDRAGALSAMQLWSNVANVTFSEVSGAASTLTFSKTTFAGDVVGLASSYYSGTQMTQSEVQVDTSVTSYNSGDFGLLVMLHEIGHALGLKHPGAYGSSDQGPYLSASEDTIQNTVMSYNDGRLVNASNYNATPMIYDIAAMQYLYGANTTFNAGDSTYSFTGAKTAMTIWDGNGTDMVSASGYTGNATIDIAEGINNVSTIGQSVVWVAFGANIENASGGSGNDRVSGNGLNNTLYGNSGIDTLVGGGGNDTVYGGAGVSDPNDLGDVIYGGSGVDALYGNGGNDTIIGGNAETDPTDGADVIYGGRGSDVIYGNGGNDTIYGGGAISDPTDAPDTIYGGGGNDLIYANGGDDVVFGGTGSDTIYGGVGADRFYFNSGDGADTLVSFEGAGVAGGDTIVIASAINGLSFTSTDQILARISYASGSAVIDLGSNNSITLGGVTSLIASDFLLA